MTEHRRADEIAADNTKDPLDKIAELALQDIDNFMNALRPPTHSEIVESCMNQISTFASNNTLFFMRELDRDRLEWHLRFIELTPGGKNCVDIYILDDTLRTISAADYVAKHIIREVKHEFKKLRGE